jgi:hypothetical protein
MVKLMRPWLAEFVSTSQTANPTTIRPPSETRLGDTFCDVTTNQRSWCALERYGRPAFCVYSALSVAAMAGGY